MRTVKGALWRLRLMAYGSSLTYLRELRRWAQLGPDETRQLQDRRLAALLRDAYDNVPYYRAVLGESGAVDDRRVDLERFHLIRPLDKDTIRSRFDDLRSRADDLGKLELNTSGGSTGEPVKFLQDRRMQTWNTAVSMLFDEWAGTYPGDRKALLWGAPRDLSGTNQSLAARTKVWLRNELQLDAYRLTNESMRRYVDAYNEFRPDHLLAYAQSLYQWAQFIEAQGLEVVSPRSIITSATALEPHMRTVIERVFRAPVTNRYGSREVGGIACERGPEHQLVVSALTHFVEVVTPEGRAAGPGQAGELLVTLLTNRAMPLIRYKIGDAGVVGAAPTAPPHWPRLDAVLGRVTDIFYTASGDQVYGGYFTRLFYHRDWVAQFQVVQEDYDRIRIRIVPTSPEGAEEALEAYRAELTEAVREAMGESCEVIFELVDEIPLGPSGKRRYTISELGPPGKAGANKVRPEEPRNS